MGVPRIGEPARSFRLSSAQGGDVALDDDKGRQAVIVWFSKGMACPFCRQKLSQLARAGDRIHGLGAELLYVTVTGLDRAWSYARQFQLPFPYLCDAERVARRAWGIEMRTPSLPWYAGQLANALTMPKPASDFDTLSPPLRGHRVAA